MNVKKMLQNRVEADNLISIVFVKEYLIVFKRFHKKAPSSKQNVKHAINIIFHFTLTSFSKEFSF